MWHIHFYCHFYLKKKKKDFKKVVLTSPSPSVLSLSELLFGFLCWMGITRQRFQPAGNVFSSSHLSVPQVLLTRPPPRFLCVKLLPHFLYISGNTSLMGVRISRRGQGLPRRGNDKLWNGKEQFLPHVPLLLEQPRLSASITLEPSRALHRSPVKTNLRLKTCMTV